MLNKFLREESHQCVFGVVACKAQQLKKFRVSMYNLYKYKGFHMAQNTKSVCLGSFELPMESPTAKAVPCYASCGPVMCVTCAASSPCSSLRKYIVTVSHLHADTRPKVSNV